MKLYLDASLCDPVLIIDEINIILFVYGILQ